MAGDESIGQGAAGVDPQFVHLRVHSAFSLLEGALPLKKIIAKAVADEQPAIGIADTNNLFAALEFSQKAADDGLQPIIGCQLSIDMEDEAEESGAAMRSNSPSCLRSFWSLRPTRAIHALSTWSAAPISKAKVIRRCE